MPPMFAVLISFFFGFCICFGLCILYQSQQPDHKKESEILTKLLNAAKYELVDLLEGENSHKELASSATPVVWMHGMGDAGSNYGMQSLCREVRDRYRTHVVCLDVADGFASISTRMEEQLKELNKVIQGDAMLKNGFHAIGNSQGGLLMRAYIEKINNPPVKKFISWTGVQNGIASCPLAWSPACLIWGRIIDPYTSPLVFSDYWKDNNDYEKYLQENTFLPDLNNEKLKKNDSYKKNMLSLEMYVLTEAENDHMVYPHVSESHGYYHADSSKKIDELEDSEGYKKDWLGLRTLKEAGKLQVLKFKGEHMQIPGKMWREQLLPLLGTSETTVQTRREEVYI